MAKYIPNFNSFSTLIDRLSIENVKLAHFEFLLEQSVEKSEKSELKIKITTQREIISALKYELTSFLTSVFTQGNYETLEEKRTFK